MFFHIVLYVHRTVSEIAKFSQKHVPTSHHGTDEKIFAALINFFYLRNDRGHWVENVKCLKHCTRHMIVKMWS